MHSPPNFS